MKLSSLKVLLEYQAALNDQCPNLCIFTGNKLDWRKGDIDYTTAAVEELREARLHLSPSEAHQGYKWWKEGTLQWNDEIRRKVFLELVDVLHFVLSDLYVVITQFELSDDSIAWHLTSPKPKNPAKLDTKSIYYNLKTLARVTCNSGAVGGGHFDVLAYLQRLIADLGYSEDDLFKEYLGKNLLNQFRWANGYKDGTYTKMWSDTEEDNDFLQKFMANLEISPSEQPEEFINVVNNFLVGMYATL